MIKVGDYVLIEIFNERYEGFVTEITQISLMPEFIKVRDRWFSSKQVIEVKQIKK